MLNPEPQVPYNRTLFGNRAFLQKMKSLGRAPIQYNWCPKKRGHLDMDGHRRENTKGQPSLAKEGGLAQMCFPHSSQKEPTLPACSRLEQLASTARRQSISGGQPCSLWHFVKASLAGLAGQCSVCCNTSEKSETMECLWMRQ